MKIISKADAMKLKDDGMRIEKFDAGKYKWTGSVKHYLGREVMDIDWVVAAFVERRQDNDGPYALIMCIVKED